MPTLSYDPLPPHSDLSRELTPTGVTFTAAAPNPSLRALRHAARSAALRAIPDALIVITLASLVAFLLLMQLNRPPNLPPIVYPLFAVFVAAIYLLAWRLRTAALTDTLHRTCQQVTVISTTPVELRIESEGPLGTASDRLPALQILDIQPSPLTLHRWWASEPFTLRITMIDTRVIDVLHGRDEAELDAVARALRKAMNVPEKVLLIRDGR